MNAPVKADRGHKTVAAETVEIENALHVLLVAITDTDHNPDYRIGHDRGPVSAAEGVFAVIDRMSTWTDAQRRADDLLDRPVAEALRRAVRDLGKRLHELGGWAAMLDACHRVADRDPANYGRRLSIIDHRWDGIGEWHA